MMLTVLKNTQAKVKFWFLRFYVNLEGLIKTEFTKNRSGNSCIFKYIDNAVDKKKD